MNHHFQFLLSVCPFPFLCCLEKVPARNHNTLRSCRFAIGFQQATPVVETLWEMLYECQGVSKLWTPAKFIGFQQDPSADVRKKRWQTCIMIANMRYGQPSVSVDDKDMSTLPNHVFLQIQIQETP